MNSPKGARAPQSDASPMTPDVARQPPDAPAPNGAAARDAAPPAATDAAVDFVWPPPDAEIDAIEVVPLTTSSASMPVLHRADTAGVNLLPGRSGLTARDLDRLAQLTRDEPLDNARTRVDWKHAGAIAVIFLLVSGALATGLYLGARDARSGRNPNPVIGRTTEIATNESARSMEAIPASPQRAGRPEGPHPEDADRSGARPSNAPREVVTVSRSGDRSPGSAGTNAAASRRVQSMRSSVDAGVGRGDVAAGVEMRARPVESTSSILMPVTAGGADTALAAVPMVPSAARRAEASGVIARAADLARIRQTVERFERAYDALDADAAHVVWPSLQVERLSRAFSALKSQVLTFERCSIDNVTQQMANVACAGSTKVVPRVGHGTPVVEAGHWQFTLKQIEGEWLIDAVDVKRP